MKSKVRITGSGSSCRWGLYMWPMELPGFGLMVQGSGFAPKARSHALPIDIRSCTPTLITAPMTANQAPAYSRKPAEASAR